MPWAKNRKETEQGARFRRGTNAALSRLRLRVPSKGPDDDAVVTAAPDAGTLAPPTPPSHRVRFFFKTCRGRDPERR